VLLHANSGANQLELIPPPRRPRSATATTEFTGIDPTKLGFAVRAPTEFTSSEMTKS
jgi:hypothetical protein